MWFTYYTVKKSVWKLLLQIVIELLNSDLVFAKTGINFMQVNCKNLHFPAIGNSKMEDKLIMRRERR